MNPWNAEKVWMAQVTTDCDCGYYNESHYTKENYSKLQDIGGLNRPCPACNGPAERTVRIVQGMRLGE